MQQRRYTEQYKAEALAALAANGGNVRGTARKLGCSHVQLARWASQSVIKAAPMSLPPEEQVLRGSPPKPKVVRPDYRLSLCDELDVIAWKIVGVARRKLEAPDAHEVIPLSQLASALASVIDKARLLRGQSTTNVEMQSNHANLDRLADSDLDALEAILAKAQAGEVIDHPVPPDHDQSPADGASIAQNEPLTAGPHGDGSGEITAATGQPAAAAAEFGVAGIAGDAQPGGPAVTHGSEFEGQNNQLEGVGR